jgi:hypothetical protein
MTGTLVVPVLDRGMTRSFAIVEFLATATRHLHPENTYLNREPK